MSSHTSGQIQWRKIALFFALAFAGTYTLVAFYVVGLGKSFHDPDWLKLSIVGMLAPAASALFLQRFVYREPVRDTLALRLRLNRWWAVAWVLGPVICAATLALSLMLPEHVYDPTLQGVVAQSLATAEQHEQLMKLASTLSVHPLLVLLLPTLVAAPTLGMFNACGEEIGWRGFLFHETRSLGFWRQCGVVAVFWYLWHAPLPWLGYGGYPDPIRGSAALFLTVALATPIFNYVRLRSGSSLAAGLLHSSVGSGTFLAMGAVKGGTPLSMGWGSFTSCAVLVVLNAALLAYHRAPSATPAPQSAASA